MADWESSYRDTCAELRILQLREMEVRRRVELAHDVIRKGEAISSGREFCHVPLDKALVQFDKAVAELEEIQAEVDRVQGVIRGMEQAASQFEGLVNVVVSMRIMQGKSYKAIAAELGYSESHLRSHMSRKRNKDATKSANAS